MKMPHRVNEVHILAFPRGGAGLDAGKGKGKEYTWFTRWQRAGQVQYCDQRKRST